MERILYPGSFRPFHNDHLKNVFKMQSLFPKSYLTIGVSEHCPRADKFLNSIESLDLIRRVINQEGLSNINVQIIKRDILSAFIFLKKNNISAVFTGSIPTTTCLGYLKKFCFWNGEIYKLDNSGVHGASIRRMIEQNSGWNSFVPRCEWDILKLKGGDI